MTTPHYNEGDKSTAPCYKCEKIVNTTYKIKSLKIRSYNIPNILQGVCDICGTTTDIPHQSTFYIKKYIKDKQKKS
jgi:5,10-methenyltetrahydromethanopterin hydrogenase